MNAKYPVIDYNGQRQEIKHVCEVCPNSGGAIFPHAFCIETVRLSRGSRCIRMYVYHRYGRTEREGGGERKEVAFVKDLFSHLGDGSRFVIPSN